MDPITFVILGIVAVSAVVAKCLTYVVERVAELNTGYELREVYVPIGS
jgi:hypothetical protein